MRRRFLPHIAALSAVLAVSAAASPARKPHSAQLGSHDRAALAVKRFTFGPRPGEIAAVEREGLDHWFDRQLAPSALDDSALERRLDAYPALRMSQDERLRRYPPPATLRRLAKLAPTDPALPADPELRAILLDQSEFYELRRDKAAKSLEEATEPMDQTEAEAILALAPAARYNRLLTLSPTDLVAFRKRIRGGKGGERRITDGMAPLQAETIRSLAGTNRMLPPEVEGARLLRDVYSNRELEAVMTEFWLNHFNIYERKSGEELSLLPAWEQTVRTHALGRFEDLLVATAESPAMLMYLDNAQSTGPDSPAARKGKGKASGLNENYARELMELHTLGVNGGYTQTDVTEVAKVFTGWTLAKPDEGGSFTFNANRHQPGTKTVLGQMIPEEGEQEGLAVLHLLATSPATAHFLSLELAQHFVSDNPPPKLVDRMSATYLATGGNIAEVLRTLFHAPEFWNSATLHAKFKTPLEYVVSAARASGAEISDPQPLQAALTHLGEPVYGCLTPNGYKDDEASWLSSGALVARMNFALDLSANRLGGGVHVDWPADLSAEPAAARTESELEALLLNEPASDQTRTAALSAATASQAREAAAMQTTGYSPASSPKDMTPTIAGLLLGSPEFQRR